MTVEEAERARERRVRGVEKCILEGRWGVAGVASWLGEVVECVRLLLVVDGGADGRTE